MSMCDDFAYARCRRQNVEFSITDDDYAMALDRLRQMFSARGVVFDTLNLPNFELPNDPGEPPSGLIFDNQVQLAIVQNFLEHSNVDQLRLFHTINDAVFAFETLPFPLEPAELYSRVCVVMATAGTGKTFVTNAITAAIRVRQHNVIQSASSGLAALNLQEGATGHSNYGIPIPCFPDSHSSIQLRSERADNLRHSVLHIWDEATQQSHHIFDCVHRLMCEVRQMPPVEELEEGAPPPPPFGSVPFLILGDFRQVLPVIPRSTRQQVVASSILHADWWNSALKMSLTTNERVRQRQLLRGESVSNDHPAGSFAAFLLRIGNGVEPHVSIPGYPQDLIEIPREIVCPGSTVNDLIRFVYGDLTSSEMLSVSYLTPRAILAPLNIKCRELNEEIIRQLLLTRPSLRSLGLLSTDSVGPDDDAALYPIEFLNSLDPSGMIRTYCHIP